MSDTHGTYQRASVLEAARLLGISPTTVRRMVRAGTLQAERVLRPQGHTFVVLVPTDSQPAASSSHRVSAEARAEQPQAEAMVALIQTTIGTVLGPLVGQLDAERQTIERQAEQLVGAAETIGALRARISMLEASTSPRAVETTPEPTWSRWPRGWIAGAATVLVLVAVVVLLAWPW